MEQTSAEAARVRRYPRASNHREPRAGKAKRRLPDPGAAHKRLRSDLRFKRFSPCAFATLCGPPVISVAAVQFTEIETSPRRAHQHMKLRPGIPQTVSRRCDQAPIRWGILVKRSRIDAQLCDRKVGRWVPCARRVSREAEAQRLKGVTGRHTRAAVCWRSSRATMLS